MNDGIRFQTFLVRRVPLTGLKNASSGLVPFPLFLWLQPKKRNCRGRTSKQALWRISSDFPDFLCNAGFIQHMLKDLSQSLGNMVYPMQRKQKIKGKFSLPEILEGFVFHFRYGQKINISFSLRTFSSLSNVINVMSSSQSALCIQKIKDHDNTEN